MNRFLFIIAILFLILTASYATYSLFYKNQIQERPKEQTKKYDNTEEASISVVADHLEIPWGMDFLPNGDILFTERPGRVRMIADEKLIKEPIAKIDEVKHIGEGGLLGITLHPNFEKNHFIYLYYTYDDNGDTKNRISRFIFENNSLLNEKIILNDIPGSVFHNGGRIKFGPDKFLYITTGDAQRSSLAQDKESLAGKILRVNDDGYAAPENPFGNLVYSYGHRNPQGLAWDQNGQLWATEHGRSGLLSGYDEINKIEIGKNYGWPEIQGDKEKPGMKHPILQSGAIKTWAPSGAVFSDNSLFFSGLRGETIYEAVFLENKISLREHFTNKFGRLRDIELGPDGFLYIATSNKDGRGNPLPEDDRIIKIKIDTFQF